MKASAERKMVRWLHIIIAIPVIGYIYGPVAGIPPAAAAVKWIFFPVLVTSGFWLWLGNRLRKRLRKKDNPLQPTINTSNGNDIRGH
jgi:hypothetical protein